jgi:hypothetical protein
MSSYCSSIRHKAKTMAPFGKTVLLLLSLFLRIAYCNGDFKFQDLENLCQDYCRYNRINRIITKRHTLQLNKKKEDNDAPFLINDMPIDFINDIIQEFDIRRVSFIIDTSNTGKHLNVHHFTYMNPALCVGIRCKKALQKPWSKWCKSTSSQWNEKAFSHEHKKRCLHFTV